MNFFPVAQTWSTEKMLAFSALGWPLNFHVADRAIELSSLIDLMKS